MVEGVMGKKERGGGGRKWKKNIQQTKRRWIGKRNIEGKQICNVQMDGLSVCTYHTKEKGEDHEDQEKA